ncbi:BON domain-containing protein [Paracoccus sp. p4-l81]|uniref:BON domain-containing protein n=1 Tax=Paracoccus sp. p4-l81 TaxID=3342806 RepID=UPI0035BB73E6
MARYDNDNRDRPEAYDDDDRRYRYRDRAAQDMRRGPREDWREDGGSDMRGSGRMQRETRWSEPSRGYDERGWDDRDDRARDRWPGYGGTGYSYPPGGMRGDDSRRRDDDRDRNNREDGSYLWADDRTRAASGRREGMGQRDDQTAAGAGLHRGRGPKGYTRSDDRIAEDACDRLSDDDMLDASNIEVSVSLGEVTLDGHVEDRHAKRRAEDCIEAVSGVTHVQNNLRVRATGDKGDKGDDRDGAKGGGKTDQSGRSGATTQGGATTRA